MLNLKRPPIVRKVKRKRQHPYSTHLCLHCPDNRCLEGFQPNVFKASFCKTCSHIHELKGNVPVEGIEMTVRWAFKCDRGGRYKFCFTIAAPVHKSDFLSLILIIYMRI